METNHARPDRVSGGLVSMEPRFFNHGDWSVLHEDLDGLTAFQWSHGFSTMETQRHAIRHSRVCRVSMEPRFFNHGDACQIRQPRSAQNVSMEPRFFNHGDLLRVCCEPGIEGLQVSMEPRFFNHGAPPRFSRVSSWASGGDFEHLLSCLQNLCDFGADERAAEHVAARLSCEHLPGFRPVSGCSKPGYYAIR